MFDRRESGYILPDGFAVVSAAFNRVADARQIARQSDEGQRLARHALHLYMGGTRETWELELRLSTTCPVDHSPRARNGNTEVVDFLPELTAWSRSLTASQEAATALAEQTLEYAIAHMDEFLAAKDVREWLVPLMVELRLGRGRGERLP